MLMGLPRVVLLRRSRRCGGEAPMATMTVSRWHVRWSSVAPALHSSPSELSFRVGFVLSLTRVAEFGTGLLVFHTASTVWVESTSVFEEVGSCLLGD
uniref:Predicted protein n=1 Tax=Hordeum vulgare subsp. vulgare TaxID=112509 RepID=F2EB55_HORVV|nr:predicted protein [Hordeum vulgare subsp. vulgare]